ncbi:RTA1 like protein [Sarocladium implicatum]|nr:RTA1 like protein [Sarocladium implicatum]
MSGVWQILTYAFRTLSIQNPSSFGDYAAWFVLILVAPLWTNAFAYVVFGRMVRILMPSNTFMRVKGWHFATIFLAFDIVAFVVQVYGAARASASNIPENTVLMGLHIYMAGVGVQLLFILVFCLVNLKMYMNLRLESSNAVKMLFLAQLIALGLIVVSIIFLAAAADGG